MILGYLKINEGATYKEIRESLALGNGQLTQHLRKLENAGYIKSKTIGFNKCFFPHKYDFDKIHPEIYPEIQMKIMMFLATNPGQKHTDISKSLDVPDTTVRYHLNSLIKKNKVKIKPYGNKEYYIIENDQGKQGISNQKTITEPDKKNV